MAERSISPSGSGGDITLQEFLESYQPGDIGVMREGVYGGYTGGDASQATGEDTARALLRSEPGKRARVATRIKTGPRGFNWLTINGVDFDFEDHSSFISSSGREEKFRGLILDDCQFHSRWNELGGSYTGLRMDNCEDALIVNCRLGRWVRGDFIRFWRAKRCRVHANNFANASLGGRVVLTGGGHSLLSFESAERCLVTDTIFRNPWQRTVGNRTSRYIDYIHNVFIDSNHDDDEGLDSKANGDVRFVVDDGVFRDNLVILSQIGANQVYTSGFQLAFYDKSRTARRTRVYRNTIFASRKNGIGLIGNPNWEDAIDAPDVRLYQNIVHSSAFAEIHMRYVPWKSWKIRENVFHAVDRPIIITDRKVDMSLEEAESHDAFKDNKAKNVQFEDTDTVYALGSAPQALSHGSVGVLFRALQHNENARPLMEVAKTVNDLDIVQLNDVSWLARSGLEEETLWFLYTNGAPTSRTVVEILDENRVRLDSPITAGEGTLVDVYENPNAGAQRLQAEEPEPQPEPDPDPDEPPPDDDDDDMGAPPPPSKELTIAQLDAALETLEAIPTEPGISEAFHYIETAKRWLL